MKKYKLSPTSLSLMRECPRCFWLTQNKIWKRPRGIFPSLPSGIDEILKSHFNKYVGKGLPPELKKERFRGFTLYPHRRQLKIWQDVWQGISYTDENGNTLKGAIDNLLIKDNKLVVIDYKTKGFAVKDDSAKYYQDQLDIYNFLFRKNNIPTHDYSFLLFYVPKLIDSHGKFIFDTTIVRVKIDIKNAEDIFKKAIKLLKGPCPRKKCEWCEFVPNQEKLF